MVTSRYRLPVDWSALHVRPRPATVRSRSAICSLTRCTVRRSPPAAACRGAEDFHADLRPHARRQHVHAVDDRLRPDVAPAGHLQLAVHLLDDVALASSARAAATWPRPLRTSRLHRARRRRGVRLRPGQRRARASAVEGIDQQVVEHDRCRSRTAPSSASWSARLQSSSRRRSMLAKITLGEASGVSDPTARRAKASDCLALVRGTSSSRSSRSASEAAGDQPVAQRRAAACPPLPAAAAGRAARRASTRRRDRLASVSPWRLRSRAGLPSVAGRLPDMCDQSVVTPVRTSAPAQRRLVFHLAAGGQVSHERSNRSSATCVAVLSRSAAGASAGWALANSSILRRRGRHPPSRRPSGCPPRSQPRRCISAATTAACFSASSNCDLALRPPLARPHRDDRLDHVHRRGSVAVSARPILPTACSTSGKLTGAAGRGPSHRPPPAPMRDARGGQRHVHDAALVQLGHELAAELAEARVGEESDDQQARHRRRAPVLQKHRQRGSVRPAPPGAAMGSRAAESWGVGRPTPGLPPRPYTRRTAVSTASEEPDRPAATAYAQHDEHDPRRKRQCRDQR